MLNVYADFCQDVLSIPVIKGEKTEKERFAGAKSTYTIESLMHDGKALQSGTSHNFGDGFARAFGIQYTDKDNQLQYVHQTSWGMSTRIIGAIIMVHGDDNGLVLPPKIAPTQVIIVPIMMNKPGVQEKALELNELLGKNLRVKTDLSDHTPGWKFSEYEMKGVPLRLEIGPKDIEKNQAVLVRRDTGEKEFVSLDDIESRVNALMDEIQANLLEKARISRDSKTYSAKTMEEFEKTLDETPGFVKAMWCGDRACEDEIKEKTGATSRCIPFEQEEISDTCICCGKKAKKMVYWGRAY
jgi:prolyl-tRNA synthetase